MLARHGESDTVVAVKYLTVPDDAFCMEFRTEFRTEAQMLRELNDPHVVRLFDYVETSEGAAIVMEAIDGISLRDLLREQRRLAPEAALAVLKGSLLGLGAAHEVGVVHRDYKPPNVMVGADGQSKLIDFGIALRSGAEGKVVGTPAYMAPEQWAGAPASPSTDVYAATCVFYECVTGEAPYRSETTEGYRALHTYAEIPAGQAPLPVQALIRRGLAKDPKTRPAGALAFAAELEATATEAYGPEWERNGWRRLAEAAAGLAALFPLTALVAHSAPGAAAAGHAGAAAAGKAAASTGHGMLAKVFGTNAATKVVAVATGVVVVGGAGTAAIVLTHHKPKKPPAAPIKVELAAYNQPVSGLDLRTARFAQITGGRDAALRRRINAALVDPLEWAIGEMKQERVESNPPCTTTTPTVLSARPELGLRGPRLVSVRYRMPKKSCVPLDYQLPAFAINVDLRTGRTLTATDVFRPETLTQTGMATLMKRVTPHITQPDLASVCILQPLKRADFDPGEPFRTKRAQPPHIMPFLTPKGLDMTWARLGSECPFFSVVVPYTEVRDLLTAKIVAELPH